MEDLTWKVLALAAKRGFMGASREDFFREIKGVAYNDLENAILSLEKDGLVSVEWTGPSKFLVCVTEKGSQFTREEYKRRIEAYRKEVEEKKKVMGEEGQ